MVSTVARVAGWMKRTAASWSQSTFGIATGYSVTDPRRKILAKGGRPTNGTANELLTASLPVLRAYVRNLERNNPSARAAIDGLTSLCVGQGIALEIETGDERIDGLLRAQWVEWLDHCVVDGRDIYELQSQGFREMCATGELLWRFVMMPERAKGGGIALSVLPLEAEWLDESTGMGIGRNADGTVDVGPVTVDTYGRPVRYRLRSPETSLGMQTETVQAADIVHVFEKRRSLQARGEPWLAPVIETLQQERDLVDAELQAAITCASIGIAITSESHGAGDTTTEGDTTDPAETLRLGAVARLFPGEKIESFSHSRPGQQIAAFRQMLRGDIAAAMRLPQRYLDRDVSRANYSSMRADMIDTERFLQPVREWFGHATIGRLFRAVLPFLCLRAGVPMPKKVNYRLLPDGQPYVDPYKDIQASAMAVGAGFTTWEAEIAKKGGDYRKVWTQLAKEREEAKALGLVLDLSGTNAPAPAPESTAGDQPTPEPAKPVGDNA